jgi:tripartite-type tricarboxylate transporter receptor subunit TctC
VTSERALREINEGAAMDRSVLRLMAWIAAAALMTSAAHAAQSTSPQAYPNKPLRLIVPFPAGGGVDAVARVVGQRLAEVLGQHVVIDNRPGSSGIIGAEIAAGAAPDGHTLLFGGSATHGITPHLYKKLPYDPVKDFAPIILLGSAPYLLVVHPSVPAHSVKELIAFARANPGKLNYASAGSGSTLHLTTELFRVMAGIDIVHIPYKGSAPALGDLLAGRVQMTFNPVSLVMPHIKAGRLRALGVTSAKATRFAPDVPAIAEAGVPGYESLGWYGVLAPAGTPPAIVRRLNRDMRAMLEEQEFRDRFFAIGVEPGGGTPDEFRTFIAAELAKWGKVVRISGARVE